MLGIALLFGRATVWKGFAVWYCFAGVGCPAAGRSPCPRFGGQCGRLFGRATKKKLLYIFKIDDAPISHCNS